MPEELAIVSQQQEIPRAEVVRAQIMQIGQGLRRSVVVLGHLLKETKDNEYNLTYGFPRWDEWVEQSSGLDLSARSAYDFVKIVQRASQLGIPDEELEEIKVSSLKTIFALPEDTDPERVKELLEEAKTMPLKDVRAVVGAMTNQDFTFHTIKNDRDVEDNIYQPALERCRREYGGTMGPDGGEQDISDSKAIEMILADYMAGAPEEDDSIIDAEFNDVNDTPGAEGSAEEGSVEA